MALKDFYRKYNKDLSKPTMFGLQLGQQAASGFGDLIDQQYAETLDNQAIANANTDYSIGALFSNKSALSNSLQSIDNNIRDVSGINDIATLYDVANPNMYQQSVKDPSELQEFGNVLSSTAEGFAEGMQTGNPFIAIADAGLRLMGAGLRNSQINRNIYRQNEQIAKANARQTEYINDQMTDIARTNTRNQLRNVFALGGDMEGSNGVNFFNAGGSHETNPLGGIPQGIASDNVPNLVEEGEVKVTFPGLENDNEIFSSKLKASKVAITNNHLDEKYIGWSWADIIKDLQKEMEPRGTSNFISNNSFYAMAERARAGQAYDRQIKEQREMAKLVNSLSDEEKATLLQNATQQKIPQEEMFESGGKIRIKKSKRGTFTAAAKKHGKSVQAFASQVLANPENYSPAMVKKANFARNFGGHKGQYGLNLDEPPFPSYGKISPRYQDQFEFVDLGDGVGYYDPISPEALSFPNDYRDYTPLLEPSIEQEVEREPIDGSRPTKKDDNYDNNNIIRNYLHELPVYANTAQMITDSFGLTNRPDTRYADAIGRARRNIRYYSPDITMSYEQYQPIDINLPANMQMAQAAELQRANRATANRASQMQNALGIYDTTSKQYGLTQLQAQQAAAAERRAVNQINNTINARRDQLIANNQQLNAAIDQQRMQNEIAEATARDASETARAQTISANRKNAYDSIGALGKQRGYQDMLYNLGLIDVFGNINQDMLSTLLQYSKKERGNG